MDGASLWKHNTQGRQVCDRAGVQYSRLITRVLRARVNAMQLALQWHARLHSWRPTVMPAWRPKNPTHIPTPYLQLYKLGVLVEGLGSKLGYLVPFQVATPGQHGTEQPTQHTTASTLGIHSYS